MNPSAVPNSLCIRLFGTFEACRHQMPLPATRTRKEEWLLALLILRHPHPVERSRLAFQFWLDSTEERALQNLRRSLNNLRDVLGADASRITAPTPRTLSIDISGADIDVVRFDAAIARGDRSGREEAVALYQGALLEGCEEDWLLPERVRREAAYLQALETLADETMKRQNVAEAIGLLRRILAVEPGREATLCTLLKALAVSGDTGGMIEAYQDFRHYLHQELNVSPTPETTDLFRQLRQSRPAFAMPLSAHSPPLVDAQEQNPPSLSLADLIGRDKEIEKITSLLRCHRLVTLTGTGGIGKTRLAQAVAQEAAKHYGENVWSVPLTDVASASHLPEAIRDALELPRSTADPLSQIHDRLAACHSLLVLDNMEHLLPDAVRFLHDLHQRLPTLTLLVTSRLRLHLVGEQEFIVAPLPVPSSQGNALESIASTDGMIGSEFPDLMVYPGVQLFVRRTQSRRAEFQITERNAATVGAVCSVLEGIPLAIELAAAWTHLLTPAQLLMRLEHRFDLLKTYREDSLPERHRSLWLTLEISYRLLSPGLQRFFARLSIFRGGWTLEAAETVCVEARSLEYIAQLHDASLLVVEETGEEMRYRFLETVRDYAAEQLTAQERDALARRHADFFLAFAEAAYPNRNTGEESRWLSRLEADHGNLREAMTCLLQSEKDGDLGLRLAGMLSVFWERRGYLREGKHWLFQALECQSAPSPNRVMALNALGYLHLRQGDYPQANPLLEEALALARQLDDQEGCNFALERLGSAALYMSNYVLAEKYFTEALAGFRKVGFCAGEIAVLISLGVSAKNQGRHKEAAELFDNALALITQTGNLVFEGITLHNLGNVMRELGRFEQAKQFYLRSLDIHRRQDKRYWQGVNLFELGMTAQQEGERETARTYLQQSITLCREVGEEFITSCCLEQMGILAYQENNFAAAHLRLTESLSLRQKLGAKREIAFTLEHLARLLVSQQQRERAGQLLGAAMQLRADTGCPIPPNEQNAYKELTAQIRSALGETAFAEALEAGRTLTPEEYVSEYVSGKF